MEPTNKEMFELYGIREWDKKSIVLRENEKKAILDDLTNGKITPLVEMSKLPFPHFAYAYFSCFDKAKVFLDDPAFGYKLYLLSNSELPLVIDYLINEKNINKKYIGKFLEFKITPLEKIPYLYMNSNEFKKIVKQYVYISQYIDQSEAERLGLGLAKEFKLLNEDGYDFKGKLDLFNPAIRSIFENYFGLNDKEPISLQELANCLGLTNHPVFNLIEDYEQYFLKPTAVLRNKIEPIGEIDGLKLYANRTFRKQDLTFEAKENLKRKGTSSEQKIFSELRVTSNGLIYIAKKYLFPSMTTKELADYLNRDVRLVDSMDVREDQNKERKI